MADDGEIVRGSEAPQGLTEEVQRQSRLLVTQSIDSLPIIAEILDTLDKRLPKNLYYHSKIHTDDVLREAVLFGLVDGLPSSHMRLLAVAAAFHDAGFIESPVDNERIGANMARAAMERHGSFSRQEVELVAQMILDTRLVETSGGLKQVPTTDLSRYLLDADLSNFGREDFFERGELQRKELGYDRGLFLRKTFELINNHRWLTNAAIKLRQNQKAENIARLKSMIDGTDQVESDPAKLEVGIERLIFLSKLPLLLNSSLETRKVVEISLEHLRTRLSAEAATVFILEEETKELTFWALKGGDNSRLEGIKMPSDKGIVGWVIEHQDSVLVNDVSNDQRFFSDIDKEGGAFKTRNLVCVPLTVRGNVRIGAIQVLNKHENADFTEDDHLFVEQFSHQVALAIDNSRLFEAVKERNLKLETLDRRKNEMIQVIAHEFRTPLNVIQTSSDLIASGYLKSEEAVKEISSTLERGVERLTKLMSQIRNVSLVSQGKLEVEMDEIDVNELLATLTKKYSEQAGERQVLISQEIGKGVSKVKGDLSLILVVLNNLISNAIRFTPDGGKVKIGAVKQAGFVKFSIADTGIGIKESELQVIFEKFYEVGDAMQHSSGELEFMSGGLGLGLATCKSILAAHGCRLDVNSQPGKGSTFSFNLRALQ
ncbi:MAG: GAF domain-containing protein [Deltaproteobacteria bacterium]|nr:GAF domain-containing protein [Deltaproteobacteria bacterium]